MGDTTSNTSAMRPETVVDATLGVMVTWNVTGEPGATEPEVGVQLTQEPGTPRTTTARASIESPVGSTRSANSALEPGITVTEAGDRSAADGSGDGRPPGVETTTEGASTGAGGGAADEARSGVGGEASGAGGSGSTMIGT
jgi:hypothetical protein